MNVQQINVGPFDSNCFLITNSKREGLLVDPGDEAARILEIIRREQVDLKVILITHGHIDHVSGLAAVHNQYPCPIAMHPADRSWAFSMNNQMMPYYGVPEAPSAIARELAEGQEWTDIGYRYDVIELPGHSPGHVGFHFPEQHSLFSGDVLFQGSVGRTDLPGGDMHALTQSLKRMARLPDDTVVYCGHGPATTVGEEKRRNPYMRAIRLD